MLNAHQEANLKDILVGALERCWDGHTPFKELEDALLLLNCPVVRESTQPPPKACSGDLLALVLRLQAIHEEQKEYVKTVQEYNKSLLPSWKKRYEAR